MYVDWLTRHLANKPDLRTSSVTKDNSVMPAESYWYDGTDIALLLLYETESTAAGSAADTCTVSAAAVFLVSSSTTSSLYSHHPTVSAHKTGGQLLL